MNRVAPLAALAALVLLTPAAHAEDSIPAKRPADTSAPPSAAASLDGPAPEIRYPPSSTRYKLLATAIVVAGGAYGVAVGAGQGWQTVPGAAQLKIPVVGPWMALSKSGCSSDNPFCQTGTIVFRDILFVIDAMVQVGGLALLVEAIAMKTEAPSAEKPAAEKKASFLELRYHDLEVRPAPVATPGGAGFGIIGTF
jgi:hypothetical protein